MQFSRLYSQFGNLAVTVDNGKAIDDHFLEMFQSVDFNESLKMFFSTHKTQFVPINWTFIIVKTSDVEDLKRGSINQLDILNIGDELLVSINLQGGILVSEMFNDNNVIVNYAAFDLFIHERYICYMDNLKKLVEKAQTAESKYSILKNIKDR